VLHDTQCEPGCQRDTRCSLRTPRQFRPRDEWQRELILSSRAFRFLPARELETEALEAERARTLHVIRRTKPVPRFFRATAGAERQMLALLTRSTPGPGFEKRELPCFHVGSCHARLPA
jgi:hypothetical protein